MVKVKHIVHDKHDMEQILVNGKVIADGNPWDEFFQPRHIIENVLDALGLEFKTETKVVKKKWW